MYKHCVGSLSYSRKQIAIKACFTDSDFVCTWTFVLKSVKSIPNNSNNTTSHFDFLKKKKKIIICKYT